MSTRVQTAAWLAILVVMPCRTAQAQAQSLADSLRGFALHMAAMLRNRDLAGTLGLYGDTANFVHIEHGEVITWIEMSAMVRKYFATARSNPVRVIGEPGVTIADADNAVVYVTHRLDSPVDSLAHGGTWTGVLHRFPQGWRVIHSHSSDRRPPGRRRRRRPRSPSTTRSASRPD
jgi:SnoaL-like domain